MKLNLLWALQFLTIWWWQKLNCRRYVMILNHNELVSLRKSHSILLITVIIIKCCLTAPLQILHKRSKPCVTLKIFHSTFGEIMCGFGHYEDIFTAILLNTVCVFSKIVFKFNGLLLTLEWTRHILTNTELNYQIFANL